MMKPCSNCLKARQRMAVFSSRRKRVVTKEGYVLLIDWVCVESSKPELVGRRLYIGRRDVIDISGEAPVAVMRGLLSVDTYTSTGVRPSQGEVQ